MMLVPRRPPELKDAPERVVAALYRDGAKVSEAAASDPRLLVQEGAGVLEQKERTVALAIPMPRRANVLEVTVTNAGAQRRFDVSRLTLSYCATVKAEPLCADPD